MNSFSFLNFYKEALDVFFEAGHAASRVPRYFNHSVQQVIYFDTNKTVLIDNAQRLELEDVSYISHLFSNGDNLFSTPKRGTLAYYSIVLNCNDNSRSQIAYRTHMLLHPAFETDMSVIMFKHNDSIMLSVIGYGTDLILSDWYNVDADYDKLIERLHISNLSISSLREFAADLCYCIARPYYFQSDIESSTIYSLLPAKFFWEADIFDTMTGYRKTIKEVICETYISPDRAYVDDYIEPMHVKIEANDSIDIELELLSIDIVSDNAEVLVDSDDDPEDEEVSAKDEYEFENVDPELFKDANRLSKWLAKNNVNILNNPSETKLL